MTNQTEFETISDIIIRPMMAFLRQQHYLPISLILDVRSKLCQYCDKVWDKRTKIGYQFAQQRHNATTSQPPSGHSTTQHKDIRKLSDQLNDVMGNSNHPILKQYFSWMIDGSFKYSRTYTGMVRTPAEPIAIYTRQWPVKTKALNQFTLLS